MGMRWDGMDGWMLRGCGAEMDRFTRDTPAIVLLLSGHILGRINIIIEPIVVVHQLL